MKEFADFVPHSVRQTLDVPKRVSKDFVKDRAEKFVEVVSVFAFVFTIALSFVLLTHTLMSCMQYELYLDEAQYENNDTLLEVSWTSHGGEAIRR